MLELVYLKRSGYRGFVWSRDNVYYIKLRDLKHNERKGILLGRLLRWLHTKGRCYQIWDDGHDMMLKGYKLRLRWEITDDAIVQMNPSAMFSNKDVTEH